MREVTGVDVSITPSSLTPVANVIAKLLEFEKHNISSYYGFFKSKAAHEDFENLEETAIKKTTE